MIGGKRWQAVLWTTLAVLSVPLIAVAMLLGKLGELAMFLAEEWVGYVERRTR